MSGRLCNKPVGADGLGCMKQPGHGGDCDHRAWPWTPPGTSEPIEMKFPVDDGVVTIGGDAELVRKFIDKYWSPPPVIDMETWAKEMAIAGALAEEDRKAWPDGHPCRDCGQLFKHHPNTRCVAWR